MSRYNEDRHLLQIKSVCIVILGQIDMRQHRAIASKQQVII